MTVPTSNMYGWCTWTFSWMYLRACFHNTSRSHRSVVITVSVVVVMVGVTVCDDVTWRTVSRGKDVVIGCCVDGSPWLTASSRLMIGRCSWCHMCMHVCMWCHGQSICKRSWLCQTSITSDVCDCWGTLLLRHIVFLLSVKSTISNSHLWMKWKHENFPFAVPSVY